MTDHTASKIKRLNEDYLGEDWWRICFDGCGMLLFDTEEEMNAIFKQTIMDIDDRDPVYANQLRVYAVTYSPEGECLSENT